MNPLLAELLRKDEEQRKAQIEANRIGPTSGMTNPYQPQDFSGQESQIAQMRSMANSLRGQPAPEGRTVGPLNVYVRPDGAKAMQHGFNQLASYMADKEANALGKTLDAQKSKDMQGQFEYQDAIDTRDFNADRADALSNQQYREGVLANQEADRQQREQRYAAEDSEREKARLSSEKRDAKYQAFLNPNYDPNNPNSSRTLYYREQGGVFRDSNDNPVDVTYLQPILGTEAEGKKLTTTPDPTKGQGVARPSLAIDILSDMPLLDKSTGALDWERQLGRFGYGPDGERVQSLQRKMTESTLGGLIPDLKDAELKPISDTDLRALRAKYPDADTQPYGHVDFYVTTYRDTFDRKFDEAIASGAKTPAEKAQYMDSLDKALVNAALEADYPAELLRKHGVNPELIELIELERKGR